MTPWLTIIGVGDDGVERLPARHRDLIGAADIIVGSRRILEREDFGNKEIHFWTSPLDVMLTRINAWKGRNVVVLATGDPMHFGIGATLARMVPVDEMTIIPAPSAFSLAAARLGWALQDVETVSLHGRPVSLLQTFIQPGARIIALTADGQAPGEVAALLSARGFGTSKLSVLEHLGGPDERRVDLIAAECGAQGFADLNTIGVECIAEPGATVLPRTPGLSDDAFIHDGQLTKKEVRAVTLAALCPVPGALLWDVGAGCGSVAIEWMRAATGTRAVAFEKNQTRLKMISENATALGVPGLEVVAGDVTQTFGTQEAPHAIFLGGAVADNSVFKTCWEALLPGGRLVANAVTLEGEAALIARQAAHGGELVRIDISRVEPLGAHRVMRPRLAVMQWRALKEMT